MKVTLPFYFTPWHYFQACMLTFYPEFDDALVDKGEILFVLDLSSNVEQVKKGVLLALTQLKGKECKFNIIICADGKYIQELRY